MTDEVETVWIICADWSEEQLLLLAGNRTAECTECSSPVVISTEGRALVAANPLTARLICMGCAIRRNPDDVPEVAPGAIERA
jgi:ribosomal protein S27E